MTEDPLEQQVRRWTAIAWLVPTVMALQGAWRGRHARGRTVGRPFTQIPWWLYCVVGTAGLLLSIRTWRPLPVARSRPTSVAASVSGGLLSGLGIGLIVWGRVALGEMYNVSSALGVRLYTGHRLITSGPFAIVRHPMYLGAFIAGLGALLVYRTWTMVLILACFPVFVARARLEDEALAGEFGEAWQTYGRRVPGWVPRLRQ